MENAATRNLHSVKSYGAVPSLHHAKSLGGSRKSSKSQEASKSELANWYTQAYNYYRAVANGDMSKPDPAKWDDFVLQMNWAYSQINEGGNIGGSSDGVNLDGEPETTEADPFGGIPGTQNNLIYNSPKAKIGFTGEKRAHDIWSNDVTIDVGTMSANVTSEITTDGRYVPAENVLKIIVKDPATGTESVYFVHDYKDAKIKITTHQESQLKSKAPGVTWEAFKETSDKKATKESSIPGELNAEGEWEYDVPLGKNIDFWPEGGEDQVHRVLAVKDTQVNITGRASTHFQVLKNEDGSFTVIATNKDGKTDTYYVPKNCPININGNTDLNSYGTSGKFGIVGKEGDPMPPDFAKSITLNEKLDSDPSKEGDAKVDTSGDTKPDKKEGDVWKYQGTEVDVHPTFDHKDNKIKVTGDVTIHLPNNTMQAKVTKDATTGDYIVTVTEGKNTLTYHIDRHAKSVNIDGPELNVDLDKSLLGDKKVHVQGKEAPLTNQAIEGYAEMLTGVGVDDKKINLSTPDNDPRPWAQDAVAAIAEGLKSGDWTKLETLFTGIQSLTPGHKNNRYEMLFLSLRGLLGGSAGEGKLKAVLSQIPPELRKKWTNGLNADPTETTSTKEVKAEYLSGSWVDDLDNDWTHQSTIDFINSVKSDLEE